MSNLYLAVAILDANLTKDAASFDAMGMSVVRSAWLEVRDALRAPARPAPTDVEGEAPDSRATWWFLENEASEWLENEPHGLFTRDPNKALKWPNKLAADSYRCKLRHPLWMLTATEHMWCAASPSDAALRAPAVPREVEAIAQIMRENLMIENRYDGQEVVETITGIEEAAREIAALRASPTPAGGEGKQWLTASCASSDREGPTASRPSAPLSDDGCR